jgi:hypothetical protein
MMLTGNHFNVSAEGMGVEFIHVEPKGPTNSGHGLGNEKPGKFCTGYEVFHNYTARSKHAKLVKFSPSSVWGFGDGYKSQVPLATSSARRLHGNAA